MQDERCERHVSGSTQVVVFEGMQSTKHNEWESLALSWSFGLMHVA